MVRRIASMRSSERSSYSARSTWAGPSAVPRAATERCTVAGSVACSTTRERAISATSPLRDSTASRCRIPRRARRCSVVKAYMRRMVAVPTDIRGCAEAGAWVAPPAHRRGSQQAANCRYRPPAGGPVPAPERSYPGGGGPVAATREIQRSPDRSVRLGAGARSRGSVISPRHGPRSGGSSGRGSHRGRGYFPRRVVAANCRRAQCGSRSPGLRRGNIPVMSRRALSYLAGLLLPALTATLLAAPAAASDACSVHTRPVAVPVDGEMATGLVYEPQGCTVGNALVVAAHGHKGSAAQYSEYLISIAARTATPILSMDMRGSPQWPTGDWNLWAGWRDLVAATQWYKWMNPRVARTVLWGWSQGAMTSGLAAAYGPAGLFDYWVDTFGPSDLFTHFQGPDRKSVG